MGNSSARLETRDATPNSLLEKKLPVPASRARAAAAEAKAMDQHGEKEAADESQDSTEQSEDDVAAAEGNAEKSTDQHAAGYKAEESAVVVIKEVSSGEESSPPLLAHPCALLQLLLRACAACLGLPGYCGDPKPAAVAAPEDAAADSSQEGEGGDKANDLYMQGEVVTRVWAVRKPAPPGRPREGGGGDGGVHH